MLTIIHTLGINYLLAAGIETRLESYWNSCEFGASKAVSQNPKFGKCILCALEYYTSQA